ncbi:MAG: DUF2968 domain-containing protein [Janthinobacterium lividum]
MHRGLRWRIVAVALLAPAGAGCAQALPDHAAPIPAAGVQAVPATAQRLPTLDHGGVAPARQTDGAGGTIAELQRRIDARELTELRTVYNGSYGASLLLAGDDPMYYVALFERKNFWRVVRTPSDARAEEVFADFSRQTTALAASEIRTLKLTAQRHAVEQLIAQSQARAQQIQADLALQQTQRQQVAERQRTAAAQAMALDAENRKAQKQLAGLRRELDDLQKQADESLSGASRRR